MSDIESTRSASPSRDILKRAANTDEVLNDHRNQASSLPIRNFAATQRSCAIDDDEDDDDENDDVENDPRHPRRGAPRSNESDDKYIDAETSHTEAYQIGHAPQHSDGTNVSPGTSPNDPSGYLDRPGGPRNAPPHHGLTRPKHSSNSIPTTSSISNEPYPVSPTHRQTNHMFMNNLRKDFYLNEGQEDDDSHPFMIRAPSRTLQTSSASTNPTTNSFATDNRNTQPLPFTKTPTGSMAAATRRGRRKSRSRSFSEQVKAIVNPKDMEDSDEYPYVSAPQSSASKNANTNYPDHKSSNVGGASSGGILLKSNQNSSSTQSGIKKSRTHRNSSIANNDHLENDLASPMMKIKTNDTTGSDTPAYKRERRASRSSIDSEADSHASRSSQETEEDVCFPMLREHVRIKGIDFDEIEEFIKDEREEEQLMKDQQQMIAERTAMRVNSNTKDARATGSISSKSRLSKPSNTALKYTPKKILSRIRTKSETQITTANDNDSIRTIRDNNKSQSDSSTVNDDYDEKIPSRFQTGVDDDDSSENVKFGGTRINDAASVLPDRFSFFSSESEETIHAPDIPSLVEPGQSVRELFRNGEGTWWLDCVCPTDSEMKMLAKAFGIHPLTAEDIRMQETREKVELFRSYYFVCFHTFEPDKESEDYLEPINVYIVVFRDGVLTFHFSPMLHPANVRRRVRQLRDYVDVSADWLCYALIDDITDGFAPVITGIEYEADAIEDSVFVARELDFSNMLQRIGESRRKVMTLMRLLSGKADVIKMFAKRCQDEAVSQTHNLQSHLNLASMAGGNGTPVPHGNGGTSFGPGPGAPSNLLNAQYQQFQNQHGRAQPRADIALYLGDIQDHVVTMFQNLLAYEKIFSRSHSNYLAQLQVESFNSNNKVTEMLSKVTLIGTMLVPLNLVTGLFGMNVHVPGQDLPGLGWFFGILGVMIFIVICSFIFAKIWLRKLDVSGPPNPSQTSSRRSIKSLGLKTRTREAAKSILSFPNKYD